MGTEGRSIQKKKNEMKRDEKEHSHRCGDGQLAIFLFFFFFPLLPPGIVRTCVSYPGRCGAPRGWGMIDQVEEGDGSRIVRRQSRNRRGFIPFTV